jgi:hypothetical protein
VTLHDRKAIAGKIGQEVKSGDVGSFGETMVVARDPRCRAVPSMSAK